MQRARELITPPVEPSLLIDAIVGTVTGADAAIVNHGVQAFGRLVGGKHGTDRFAAGIIALLAHLG